MDLKVLRADLDRTYGKDRKLPLKDIVLSAECLYRNFDHKILFEQLKSTDWVEPDGIVTEPITELVPGKYYRNIFTGRVCMIQSIKDADVNYLYMIFGPAMCSTSITKFHEIFEFCPHVKSLMEV